MVWLSMFFDRRVCVFFAGKDGRERNVPFYETNPFYFRAVLDVSCLFAITYVVCRRVCKWVRCRKTKPFSGWFLAGAEAGEDDGEGAGENFQVEPEGPVVDVLEVEFHPLVEADLVAAADLPDAGEAGLHGEAAAM